MGSPLAPRRRGARAPAVGAASEAYREKLATSDREWQREDAERVDTFLAFIRDLSRDLAAYPEAAPWSEHLAYLERLLRHYVEAPEPILDSLAGLHRFDALDDETTFERFRQTVVAAIENLRTDEAEGRRAGAFGLRGINVLDVNSLRHLRFRAVAIVGVAERAFPAPPRPDPILLDHERERLNARARRRSHCASRCGPRAAAVRASPPTPPASGCWSAIRARAHADARPQLRPASSAASPRPPSAASSSARGRRLPDWLLPASRRAAGSARVSWTSRSASRSTTAP